MRINNNMAALNAWKSMSTNNANLTKSLERLSSGYRVNKAADDAAGLAVSEKMRAQLRGIGMAIRNTGDGVSLMQTAEGGASKIQEAVQRMRELSVQAASDGLQDEDREKLQEEFSQLISAIDNTTDTVKFNGRTLLDGSSGSAAKIQSGTSISSATVGSSGLTSGSIPDEVYVKATVTQVARSQTINGGAAANSLAAPVAIAGGTALSAQFVAGDLASGSITFAQDGTTVSVNMLETDSGGTQVKDMTGDEFVTFVNAKAADAGVDFRIELSGGKFNVYSNSVGSAGDVTVTETFGVDADITFGLRNTATGYAESAGQDAQVTLEYSADNTTYAAGGANYTATAAGNTLTGTNYLAGLTMEVDAAGETIVKLNKSELDFQTGANSGETISAALADLTSTALGVGSLDVSTKAGATTAITTLDTALSTLNEERAKMGAIQNRLDSQISSLQTQYENLTAAESRIRDVDMASEMAQFTKYQVLSQASTSMLSQANQLSQGILSLLR